MFTGLVQGRGRIAAIAREGDGARLTVMAGPLADQLSPGDSLAVNGVCLTATRVAAGELAFDVLSETLRRSSLGRAAQGGEVNLELPLRAGDRLGGHVVQGHVDGLGTVATVEDDALARAVRIDAPGYVLRYVVEKGSIAVDGVSLTVAEVDDEGFAVSLIPETLERTTLGTLAPGSSVNLEVDVLAKYVEKLTSRIAGVAP